MSSPSSSSSSSGERNQPENSPSRPNNQATPSPFLLSVDPSDRLTVMIQSRLEKYLPQQNSKDLATEMSSIYSKMPPETTSINSSSIIQPLEFAPTLAEDSPLPQQAITTLNDHPEAVTHFNCLGSNEESSPSSFPPFYSPVAFNSPPPPPKRQRVDESSSYHTSNIPVMTHHNRGQIQPALSWPEGTSNRRESLGELQNEQNNEIGVISKTYNDSTTPTFTGPAKKTLLLSSLSSTAQDIAFEPNRLPTSLGSTKPSLPSLPSLPPPPAIHRMPVGVVEAQPNTSITSEHGAGKKIKKGFFVAEEDVDDGNARSLTLRVDWPKLVEFCAHPKLSFLEMPALEDITARLAQHRKLHNSKTTSRPIDIAYPSLDCVGFVNHPSPTAFVKQKDNLYVVALDKARESLVFFELLCSFELPRTTHLQNPIKFSASDFSNAENWSLLRKQSETTSRWIRMNGFETISGLSDVTLTTTCSLIDDYGEKDFLELIEKLVAFEREKSSLSSFPSSLSPLPCTSPSSCLPTSLLQSVQKFVRPRRVEEYLRLEASRQFTQTPETIASLMEAANIIRDLQRSHITTTADCVHPLFQYIYTLFRLC